MSARFVERRPIQPVDKRWLKVRTIKGLADHDVIYSLAAGPDGRIYLGVSNERASGVHAQLWSYDPRDGRFRHHYDVAPFAPALPGANCIPHCKMHLCLEVDSKGVVYAMTHFTVPARGEKHWLPMETWGDPMHGYEGALVLSYDPRSDRAERLGVLAPHEGARVMTIDRKRRALYATCYPRNHLYRYDIDDRRVRDLGRIGQENSFGLSCDRRGRVFVTDDRGTLLRYDPDADRLEALGLRLPDAPWRAGYGNYARRMTVAPDGTVWGITTKSVRLFHYDPYDGPQGRLDDHGVLVGRDNHDEWPVLPPGKAIVVGPDGWCYVALGGDAKYCDPSFVPALVRYDPSQRRTEMLGLLQGENLTPPITPQDAVLGPDGCIYIGVQTFSGPPQLAILSPAPHPLPTRRSATSQRTRQLRATFTRRSRIPDIAQETGFFNTWAAHVERGHVTMRELGWRGVSKVIPRGECRITGLTMAPSGKVYGVTSGRKSHLFVFDPHHTNRFTETPESHPCDLNVLPCRRARALAFAADGRLVIGAEDRLMVYSPECEKDLVHGLLSLQYRPPFPAEMLDLKPTQHVTEGFIEALVPVGEGALLVGLTSDACTLFVYDPERDRVVQRVRLPESRVCRAIASIGDAVIASAGPDAELFRFDVGTGRLECTGRRVPAEPGRERYNYADSFAVGSDGRLYGGSADGLMFEINPETMSIRTIGRTIALPRMRTMAALRDGRVFAVAGPPNAIARLACYDPSRAHLGVLGILQVAAVPRFWTGYDFESMAVSHDGSIYLGESDDVSHLFLYCPEPLGA